MKKKLFKIFFSLLIIFLSGLGVISLSFKQRSNRLPLPPLYKKGVFHIHSNFSDGRGSIDEISRDARRSNLDFVILSDHGRPNRAAAAATSWTHDVLLIGASEFSLHEGHLAAAGYRVPAYIFPPEAQEAVDEVNHDRGVSFVSHWLDRKIPWTGWRVREFTGIEILSLYQLAKKAHLFKMIVFPLQYLFNSNYALTNLITVPQKESQIWDSLNKEGKYYGIYALDAHAKLQISKSFQLNFPTYESTFKILTVYVKAGNDLGKDPLQAAAAVIAAIRRGDFFNVIESLAPANGFENYYLEKDGRQVEMGGDAKTAGGTLVFKLPFNFSTDIVVKKDGKIFKTISANNSQQLSMPISVAGVYRAEIYLHTGRFNKLPWILANPIAIDQPAPEIKSPKNHAGVILADRENYFQAEKNSRSSAAIHWDSRAENPPITRFTFTLQPDASNQVDFWTAMAHREKLDGSPYQGFVFETRGSRQMRFWLQIRTGTGQNEAAYQHSFLVKEQWQKIVIPFSRFYRLYGRPASVNPAHIGAFFFLIDNGNAYPGAQEEVFFREIGLY